MGKKTKLLLIAALAFLFFALVFYFIVFKKNQTAPQTSTSPQPTSVFPAPSPDEPKMVISTQQGSAIINNIYQNPLENLSGNGISFKDTEDYYMAYYPQNQGFLIVLQNSDIKSAREKAERDFLQILGVDETTACNLDVSITIPYEISPQAAGGVYGLSFCPDAKSF
jgi:hypothetical protein